MAINYAWSPEIRGECHWTLRPWYSLGMKVYDKLSHIPSDHVLVVSHFAPWWEPLRSWIAEGRAWIEIDYGYWGLDTPRRETRRVTYCGHHNTNTRPRPWSRVDCFSQPATQDWQKRLGDYVLVPMPLGEILMQRTGESITDWQQRMTEAIRPYWSGDIRWRSKAGSKNLRFARLQQELAHAHAMVGERTMACAESVALGVPAYSVDHSIVTPLMGGVENLANPAYPDRSDWWDHVCWSQFHAKEFDTDAPAVLTEFYQITGTAENVDRYRPADLLDHSSEPQPAHESTECDQTPGQIQSG